ncbi:hypothetical protein PMAYCL1PPCAC_00819 [Pristionchus mayeri]|uniref:Uncharacterized protein n=1 Tax=Pristionchus mayeri TaxID=1317129 RepID=A0AAN4YZL4_9BILA|nr:hypothetical protein PMAYCL1PPCAC_00819 [Pristionchus mayeri]
MFQSLIWWETMNRSPYMRNDKIILELGITSIDSEKIPIADPARFSAPNGMSNVILKIGDKKLHVSKEVYVSTFIYLFVLFSNFV